MAALSPIRKPVVDAGTGEPKGRPPTGILNRVSRRAALLAGGSLAALAVVQPLVFAPALGLDAALAGLITPLAAAALGAPALLLLGRGTLGPVRRAAARAREASIPPVVTDSVGDPELAALLSAIEAKHEVRIAALKRALAEAQSDPVTGLPTRAQLMSRLAATSDAAGGRAPALALIDLDDFRRVNFTSGPRVADALLNVLAERLSRALATSRLDLQLGRFGADQFGLVGSGVDPEAVRSFAAEALAAIADPVAIEGTTLRIGAACGFAALGEGEPRAIHELVKRAEVALREAKQSRRDRIVVFDRSLEERSSRRAVLEEELRRGLDRNEFVAVFQPKVDLVTGELIGAEALARWRRTDGRVVGPGVFVPIAEELGLVPRLGASVMQDACVAASRWNRRRRQIRVAVNVSPFEIDAADFAGSVNHQIETSGLSPHLLELEITESAAVADPDHVSRCLWPLRSRGVRLAVDDFGTGHSNLSAITRLPFDTFKIDQQFVRALSDDPNAGVIVEMILAMASALGQETVAEGVETREQDAFLSARHCQIGQGYLYSPPLPSDEFDALIESWTPQAMRRSAA